MAVRRSGIRFQISLLLLLSALNGIFLLTVIVGLFASDPTSVSAEVEDGILSVLLVWVALFTLVTVFSAFRLQKSLSDPMAMLSDAARRVAGGELDRAIPVQQGADELRDLSGSLESMRQNLVSSIDELDDQNKTVTAMLDALRDGVLLVDEKHRVESWNPAAEYVLEQGEYPRVREGQRIDQLLQFDASLFSDQPSQTEQDRETARGSFHLSVHIQPLPKGWVVVTRDVTKAVEITNLKQEFMSVVTHELKTPLTAIQGYTRLLLMGKGGDLSPKQADLLTRSREQTGVLYKMVNDLLDASRLEGGNLALDIVPTDLPAQVEDAVSAFSGEALRRRVKLRLRSQLLPGSVVQADPMRLQQILGNLVRNAIKFTEQGGKVTLHARTHGGFAVLAIEDTGRGIPEEAQRHLFEKFFQVERGDKRLSGGAGLGLYIVDQLTRAMNGTIEVRSVVGEGSTFTLRFPLVEAP
ncbi:MAG: HAMP domain-containing protein [Proteobacteria bacterium]|nr:HAMP domain-containing protein [Pseudomonadota bacterium]MCP4921613.1 HAMP domain-containing protein [Pseudomonadota bacterium]